jgi:shikimate dehydrogenase
MRIYGLVGKPLTHSFSKTYFTEKFAKERIADCSYENFPLNTIEEFTSLIQSQPDLKGLNVTIPYKEQVISFLHESNDVVKKIGACNCIRIEDGKLYGFNTDVIGFTRSLQPYLKQHHKKALILGTGGAAKAVEYSLGQLGIEYYFVSRNSGKAISYNDIDEKILSEYTIIVNTTPVGMYPNVDDTPDLPYQFLSSHHFLFDLIYNPAKTKFLQEGEKRGATILNGYKMLIIQAEESWKIWNS